MLKKIVLLFFLSVSVFSLSMCINVFSALSEPVTENYYQISLPRTGQTAIYQAGDDGSYQKGAVWPSPRFNDNGNGTITDRLTGLMWERVPASPAVDWYSAISYCENLTLGGHSDWRLPNVSELKSLVNYEQENSDYWLNNTQGFENIAHNYYFTASTQTGTSSSVWLVYMSTGLVLPGTKGSNNYVLAVRGGM